MTETPLNTLDARQQKLLENARVALQRQDFDYALEATAQVLRQAPGCVAVRRFRRAVQLRQRREVGEGILAKVVSGVSSAPFLFGAAKKPPEELLRMAEDVLEKHPRNVAALKSLALAAEKLAWRDTVAFAREAVREIEPDNRANVLELGEALLAADRPAEALRVADAWLRDWPTDGDAQDLMRRASIAETLVKGRWETEGTFRGKLRTAAEEASAAS